MGLFSGMSALARLSKIKSGGTAKLSFSEITSLIVNLQDAKKNLPADQYRCVLGIFQALHEMKTKMRMDLLGYYTNATVIIGLFNRVAPYEYYSGLEKHEAVFFMDFIEQKIDTFSSPIEVLLSSIREDNPYLDLYLQEEEMDIEIYALYLYEIVKSQSIESQEELETYVEHLCSIDFTPITREHAMCFCGILAAHQKFGKSKALRVADKLFRKWIEELPSKDTPQQAEGTATSSLPGYTLMEISTLCGALYPNGVVSKTESEQLSATYRQLFLLHIRGQE